MAEEASTDTLSVSMGDICIAYKQVFSTPEGQIVIADLLHRFGFTRHSMFTPGTTRPEDVLFREGQRDVVRHIGVNLDSDPAGFEEQKVEM